MDPSDPKNQRMVNRPLDLSDPQVDRMMGGPSGLAVIWHRNNPTSVLESSCILTPLSTIKVVSSAWKSLPLPLRLGVNLVYITKHDNNNPIFTIEPFRNTTLEVLTTDCDPESAGFGKAAQRINGGVVFKFAEGSAAAADETSRLSKAPMDSLVRFVKEHLEAIKAALENDGLEAANKEYAKMTPVEFKMHFKRYLTEKRDKFPSWEWEKQTCPVEVAGEHCENCGDEKEGEMALMKCGKCRKVLYCGRECQKEDWRAHKPVCVAT